MGVNSFCTLGFWNCRSKFLKFVGLSTVSLLLHMIVDLNAKVSASNQHMYTQLLTRSMSRKTTHGGSNAIYRTCEFGFMVHSFKCSEKKL